MTARHRGFTLLELLVVMSLLSVIMIGLTSALRTMAQTESKIDQRLERLDEMRVVRAFLLQTLNRISAQKMDEPGATGKTMVSFVATPDSVTWVGIMPARSNLGGRYFFRLAVEDVGASRELVMRFAPWSPALAPPDWAHTENRLLLKGVEKLDIQAQGLAPQGYNGAKPWPQGWQTGWPVADALPEQLRLRFSDAQGEWPEWIVALRALPQSDSSFNLVTVGGGS